MLPARAPANGDSGRAALVARWVAASHRSPELLESYAGARPPADLNRLVAAELSVRGRYRLAAERPAVERTSPWLEFWAWVRDRWNDLWRAAFGRVRLGPGGAVVAGDALMAIVALLLLVVAFRLLSGLAIERRGGARAQRLESPRDASALYATACAFARAGDYTRASAALFAAAIASLSARGVVRDDRSATVGDLRRTLRPAATRWSCRSTRSRRRSSPVRTRSVRLRWPSGSAHAASYLRLAGETPA